jgi:hypothetical protein
MVQGYHLDPAGGVADERFAVVYAPKRTRDRVPEGNVQVVETEVAAHAAADPVKKLFPARVIGPARSSEGVSVYYVVCWLDGGTG